MYQNELCRCSTSAASSASAQRPAAVVRAAFLAAFGEQQALVGPAIVHQLHMVEVVFQVPVEAGAPHVARRLRVAEDGADGRPRS